VDVWYAVYVWYYTGSQPDDGAPDTTFYNCTFPRIINGILSFGQNGELSDGGTEVVLNFNHVAHYEVRRTNNKENTET
jgi:hypothetical protein